MTSTHVLEQAAVQAVAETLLQEYAVPAEPAQNRPDSGPAILATLAAGQDRPPGESAASRALATWLRDFRSPHYHPGLFGGGASSRMFALRIAATTWPLLDEPLAKLRAKFIDYVAAKHWRTTGVGWEDYDLIVGPAGVLVAFAIDPDIDAAGRAPLLARLALLCEDEELSRLRVGRYEGEKLRGWNFGRINLGLAHGLPGIVMALRAAAEADGLSEELNDLLRRLAARLVAESYVDDRGVITWPFGTTRLDGHRAPRGNGRRQAWCYGGPGNAWTLWETARVLGDDDLGAFALESARSFLAAYDDELYLDGLGICHGAAGLMLVFDAFARSAGLPEAAKLADHLTDHLMGRLDEPAALAETGWSLLEGAPGVLSALLTRNGGDRRWLAALGLR
ncbi:lanthionine synthetase LanC family protein [Nonomuraea sp. NPDC005650]|uniref:lanthionine synthetase LanC family protein n=1 Tax=Nonomuraea sp. NPDC005650 TaxID=3157045 RepID=UPI0033B11C7E